MEYELNRSNDDYDELIMIANPDDSGASNGSEDENDLSEFDKFLFYQKVYNNYTEG